MAATKTLNTQCPCSMYNRYLSFVPIVQCISSRHKFSFVRQFLCSPYKERKWRRLGEDYYGNTGISLLFWRSTSGDSSCDNQWFKLCLWLEYFHTDTTHALGTIENFLKLSTTIVQLRSTIFITRIHNPTFACQISMPISSGLNAIWGALSIRKVTIKFLGFQAFLQVSRFPGFRKPGNRKST